MIFEVNGAVFFVLVSYMYLDVFAAVFSTLILLSVLPITVTLHILLTGIPDWNSRQYEASNLRVGVISTVSQDCGI